MHVYVFFLCLFIYIVSNKDNMIMTFETIGVDLCNEVGSNVSRDKARLSNDVP